MAATSAKITNLEHVLINILFMYNAINENEVNILITCSKWEDVGNAESINSTTPPNKRFG